MSTLAQTASRVPRRLYQSHAEGRKVFHSAMPQRPWGIRASLAEGNGGPDFRSPVQAVEQDGRNGVVECGTHAIIIAISHSGS